MNKDWYNLDIESIYNKLDTNESGLSKQLVTKKQDELGKNILPKKKRDSIFKIFFHELKDPIVLLLVATIIFSLMIGEVVDAVAILLIVLIDLIMGTYQENKANKTAESLANLIVVNAKVIRDGNTEIISSEELVPGDIILLESGDKISADLRIIESHNLTIDESILTGESVSVEKNAEIIEGNKNLQDRFNMAYAGCSVVTGRGKAIVVSTGLNTEIGTIATSVNDTKEAKSPLTIRTEKFSKQITILIIIIAILLTILLVSKGTSGKEIFLSVIALSVSAMPEGLPLALTMALTIASNKMSKKNVIVKKLNSVEALGSCTVIASDKTGTLTINEQTAKKIVLKDGSTYQIEGTGYKSRGRVIPVDNADIKKAEQIGLLGTINNEAKVIKNKYVGDSVDSAFLVLGKKLDVDISKIEILGNIPYESENKYSAVFFKYDRKIYCTIKGSLEKVLSFCSKEDIATINEQNELLASEGYRVIAIACKEMTKFTKKEDYTDKDIPNLDFLGLTAFIDPIREEAKKSIAECKSAGIKVLMITGDHPLTAFKISKDLDLTEDYSEVTTTEEVAKYLKLGHKKFDEFIKTKKVFTRVTPIQKLEIVESLRRQKEFVAVTGDGVNDAPAIRTANIGIAMGSGTDVAKETSNMIIIDDNFKSIVSGIKEGRTAYSNIRKITYFLLSCGLAEVLFFTLSIIMNLPMPLVAIQLLWLNVVTDGLQDIALSFEKGEDTIMQEKPRRTNESLFDKNLIKELTVSGITIGILVFVVWYYLIKVINMDVAVARGYIMALMVFIQNIHVFNCRSEKNSAVKVPIKTNPLILVTVVAAVILQIIVMEVPLLSQLLKTSSIPVNHLVLLFVFAIVIFIVMEIYKMINNKLVKEK